MMNYFVAHEVALKKFRSCTLEDMARCSGYSIEGNALSIEFLGGHYKVGYPCGDFEPVPVSDGELPIFTQILILHYLANRTKTLDTGKLISYKELPGGSLET